MLTAVLTAAAMLAGPPQSVSVIARNAPAAEAAPADESEAAGAETRRVCRYERATGSTLQRRVCRNVPRTQYQDQEVREFMRDHQRWDPLPSG